MNIQEIIESGIIKLYVMNALSEDEAVQVETLALAHPEIRMEIENTQILIEKYAQIHAVASKTELKQEILRKIEAISPQNTPFSQELPTTTKASVWGIRFLAVWAAGASIVAVFFFFDNMKQKKSFAECATQNTKLIDNQKLITYKLDILRHPDTKTIEMKGLDISPNAKVLVYWNGHEKATFLSIQNLDQPKHGKQYQLWAIVNKKTVDAGVFIYNITTIQQMKGFQNAEAFTITLEKEGGSQTPTIEEMYAIGTVL